MSWPARLQPLFALTFADSTLADVRKRIRANVHPASPTLFFLRANLMPLSDDLKRFDMAPAST